MEAIEIVPFIQEMLSSLGNTLSIERIKTRIVDNLPPVAADPVGLERMLLNLVTNALKFSPPARPVTIQATLVADTIELSVVDQGPGIGPNEQKNSSAAFTVQKSERQVRDLVLDST